MSHRCEKCNRELEDGQFFTYKNGDKTEMCKKCLTMHFDCFDDSTYMWLLEKLDVPYVPEEWAAVRDQSYAKNPKKLDGVFGKYLSRMRLKQYKDYRWADTARACEDYRNRQIAKGIDIEEQDANLKTRLAAGEISEAEYRTLASTETQYKDFLAAEAAANTNAAIGENNAFQDSFVSESELMTDNELTQEDKIYLATKWGRTYKPMQWIQLEQLYNQFMESFTIEGAARLDTLKKICKTSLKMDEAIDCGDLDGFTKLSRAYDALMKSAKFTEAQRKEEKDSAFNSAGVIVMFAEKHGHAIPRHKIEVPLDKADEVMLKLKDYYTGLINNDPTIRQLIENYVKKREIAAAMKKDQEEAKKRGLNNYEVTDQDFIDNSNYMSELIKEDIALQGGKV